jgi:hypothetical protein
MPAYTYYCKIHQEFEIEHSVKDKLLTCPKCLDEGLPPQSITRLISGGTLFILNGSCWAKDNYS